MADRWPVMAGSAHARFPLIRNNSSCKTPEPDYPKAFPSGLGSSHFLPGFRRRLPEGFSSYLGSSSLLPNFRRSVPDGFPSSLGSLTSSHTSEEDYPRAFLQASEVSHPPILPKKTTQGSDYSSSGGSRVLMMAFSNSAIPTAPRCIKGLPSIGMKRREGIERIPNRAASSFSSSTLTL